MNSFFARNPSLGTIVIVTPRCNKVRNNPDQHFGKIGRSLLKHLRQELGMDDKEFSSTKRLCLYETPGTLSAYKDVVMPITGNTPFKQIPASRTHFELREHITGLRSECRHESDTLFIICSDPYKVLVAIDEDLATGHLPSELPPLSALIVTRASGKTELKDPFIHQEIAAVSSS